MGHYLSLKLSAGCRAGLMMGKAAEYSIQQSFSDAWHGSIGRFDCQSTNDLQERGRLNLRPDPALGACPWGGGKVAVQTNSFHTA